MTTRPGFFDADWLYFDGSSARLFEDLGWLVQYQGGRWRERGSTKTTVVGTGILVLDRDNPERILYRSEAPRRGTDQEIEDWQIGSEDYARIMSEDFVPDAVVSEIKQIYEKQPMPSDMTKWLRRKAGIRE